MERTLKDSGRFKVTLIDYLDFRTETNYILSALNLVSNPLKIDLFNWISPLLSDKAYWFALGHIHNVLDLTDKRSIDETRLGFKALRSHREFVMTRVERKYLKSLPKMVTIYRGMTVSERESGKFGLSWTLSKKKAEFFAYEDMRYLKYKDHEKTVHSLTVSRDELIAYFNGRKEKEVIYDIGLTSDDLPF